MIHLFISYGNEDRDFARKLSERINTEYQGKIISRVVEDFERYDGKTWRQKVLDDLNESSIFIIILTENSKNRPWPNQELGYAWALLDNKKIKHIIPIVEAEEVNNGKIKFIKLRGFIPEDMTKEPYLIEKQRRTINRIIAKLNSIDLKEIEKSKNPLLSNYKDEELIILENIFKKIFESDINNYIHLPINDEFPDLQEDFINETIELFHKDGIINKSANTIDITTYGFGHYGPIFLQFNVKKAIDDVFNFILTFNTSKEICDGQKIYEATKFSSLIINHIVMLLENEDYLKVNKYMGTRPYWFYSVELTIKSKRILRDRREDKINPPQ